MLWKHKNGSWIVGVVINWYNQLEISKEECSNIEKMCDSVNKQNFLYRNLTLDNNKRRLSAAFFEVSAAEVSVRGKVTWEFWIDEWHNMTYILKEYLWLPWE